MSLAFNTEKPTLIYVGDPMCSWCYGISGELESALDQLGDRVDVEVVTGGLRAGGGDQWNEAFTSFLRSHWQEVSHASGQPFSYDLLDLPLFNYDTEPACRSVVVVRDMHPEKEVAFFKAVQKGFYVKNKDPKQVDFYADICHEMDIDFAAFKKSFTSDEYKVKVTGDFQRARALGVSSFPTLLIKSGENIKVLGRGYMKSEAIVSAVELELSK